MAVSENYPAVMAPLRPNYGSAEEISLGRLKLGPARFWGWQERWVAAVMVVENPMQLLRRCGCRGATWPTEAELNRLQQSSDELGPSRKYSEGLPGEIPTYGTSNY